MNCHDAILLKHAWADGELDPVRSLEVEQHLKSCRACSLAFENVQALKSAIKSEKLYFKAPGELERNIRASLRLERPRTARQPPSWWQWFRLAIPSMGVAVAAVALVVSWNGPSAEDRLVQEVSSSHARSLMAEHKFDVASADPHTVKPWLDSKLDFAPPVVDLVEHGFPLIGGRLDYLQNRPVAALVYQRRKHFINLFIWPAPSDTTAAPRLRTWRGYNLVHWTQAGMICWAVSDLNAGELKQFAGLVRSGG
jgi:anti-sigma factor RsiW